MSKWFRLYDEALNDPKVQRLAPHVFKAWFNLLCLANKAGNGVLPSIADIAYSLRMSDTDAQSVIEDLILAGLIDIAPDKSLSPHNWNVRQAPSDKSKDRTKKWREGKSSKAESAAKKHPVTAPDRHSDGAVTASDGNGDALDQTRPDTDTDNNYVRSTDTLRTRAKRADQGLKFQGLTGLGRSAPGRMDRLKAKAEGLGLPVDDLIADTTKHAKSSPEGYFKTLCINRLKDRLPKVSDAVLADAVEGKSQAYTLVMVALSGIAA